MANKIVDAKLVLDVFKEHGAYITLCDVKETVKYCNKNGGEMQCYDDGNRERTANNYQVPELGEGGNE